MGLGKKGRVVYLSCVWVCVCVCVEEGGGGGGGGGGNTLLY